ncbi:hypothetical protein BDF19DRAFT_423500 [Syncephalis fuscata]|nr:hypothetical protein BDF19DRAFT_423500 [Syncephalis fuscata]
MSLKPHSKSPLLGERSNGEAEVTRSPRYHHNTTTSGDLSKRRSTEPDIVPAIPIPVEDDTWVGGRRPEKRRRDTIVGYFLLIAALAMFTAQTEATSVLETRAYRKPYFILWIVHSSLVVILPVQLALEYWSFGSLNRYFSRMQRGATNLQGFSSLSPVAAPVTATEVASSSSTTATTSAYPYALSPQCPPSTLNGRCENHYSLIYRLSVRCLWLSVILAAGAYMWYVAAGMTSSATLTAIYNASCCFVYVFSVLLFGEAVRLIKVLAVLLSIGGVAYMSFADHIQPNKTNPNSVTATTHTDTFVGDLVALGSAVVVGLYQVLYRHYAVPHRHNSLHFVNTMVGLMGVFTLLACWIPIPILHFIGWERFEWPDAVSWGWIAVISLSGILYNVCYTFVIALISPLFASVGIMLTIPVVALTDWLIQGKPVTLAMALGSAGILVGFGLLVGASWKEEAASMAKSSSELSNDTEEEEEDDDDDVETGHKNGEESSQKHYGSPYITSFV